MKQKLIVGAIIIAVVVIGMVFLSNKASASESNSFAPPSKPPSPLDLGAVKGSLTQLTLQAQAAQSDAANRQLWLDCKANSKANSFGTGFTKSIGETGTDVCGATYGYDVNGNKIKSSLKYL